MRTSTGRRSRVYGCWMAHTEVRDDGAVADGDDPEPSARVDAVRESVDNHSPSPA